MLPLSCRAATPEMTFLAAHSNVFYVLAALQTYHVSVITGNKMGSGTDANVYLVLFGENDDTGESPVMACVALPSYTL